MAIRVITFTVGSDLSVTPTSPQQAGVQGDHKATEVRFTIPPAVSGQCDKWYMELITGCGSYDKTETLTVQNGQVSFLLPREWTQDEGVANIRLVGISTTIDDDTGEEVAAAVAHTFEGKLAFATRQDAVSKVKPLVDKEIALLMEQAKAAVECAEQVAETEQRVVQLESQAKEAAENAASSQGMAEFLANNAAAMERAAAQHASAAGQYAEAAEEAAQKAQQYAESGGVPDAVYDPNSDNAQSGKAVSQAMEQVFHDAVAQIPVTDVTYDAESPNPQSGRAVAEALAGIPTGAKPMRLIAKGTTTEAVDYILVNQDMDGNAFELTDTIDVYVEIPAAEKANTLYVQFYATVGEYLTFHAQGISTKRMFVAFHLWYNGGFWDGFSRANAEGAYGSNIGYIAGGRVNCKKSSYKQFVIRGTGMPVGTKYEIYGRDV